MVNTGLDAVASIESTRSFSLGYSPCPNDCFIFHALAHGLVATDMRWRIQLDDVEALNQQALAGALDLSKVSYHAYGHMLEHYVMLRSGGALGRGVGPLIVSKQALPNLRGKRVAIPGGLTTANLLLRLSQGDITTVPLRYDRIMPAVAAAEVDAGLIIHESRFTYQEYGLRAYMDLGAWWEEDTGLPLPLGGIVAKRSLGQPLLARLDAAIAASVGYAWQYPQASEAYVAAHAQEMNPQVRQQHIDLYVNSYSLDVAELGEQAVKTLLGRAQAQGLLPAYDQALFVSDSPAFA